MQLVLNKDFGKRKSTYTEKEILEDGYPDLLHRAETCVKELVGVQNGLVKAFPTIKKQLLPYSENSENFEAQVHLLHYFALRSLYAFAEELWKMVNESCRQLVQAIKDKDSDAEGDIKKALENKLDTIERFCFDGIMHDQLLSFYRLSEMIDKINSHVDFLVMKFYSFNATWSYKDIKGSILNGGLQNENLWESAYHDEYPGEANIDKILL